MEAKNLLDADVRAFVIPADPCDERAVVCELGAEVFRAIPLAKKPELLDIQTHVGGYIQLVAVTDAVRKTGYTQAYVNEEGCLKPLAYNSAVQRLFPEGWYPIYGNAVFIRKGASKTPKARKARMGPAKKTQTWTQKK